MEDRHRHLHAGREGPAAQQVLSVQFDAVQVAVIAHQPHLRQPLAARQAQLFARQLGLPVEKPVFGTRHKVGGGHRRRRQVGQIVRHLDPVGQRTADQVAEIHRRQPQRILRPPQVQFALVEFHPHLQHVVLRFEAMLACTLDRTQQLREQRMVTFGHLPHLTRTDHRSVGPRRRDDHLRSGQPPVLLRHFTADPRHAITRAHLAAHVEGLFERYAAAVDPTHLVGEVQAGEERRTARGHPVDTQHGQRAAGDVQPAVGRRIEPRPRRRERRKEIGPRAAEIELRRRQLPVGRRQRLVVRLGLLDAGVERQPRLREGSARQSREREYDKKTFHRSILILKNNA